MLLHLLALLSAPPGTEVPVPAWENYFRNLCNLYFIHIGANCGTNTCNGAGNRKDPVWDYQSRFSWHGAVVEANPLTFDDLRKNYMPYSNVEPLNVAIHNRSNGSIDFWCPHRSGLSTLRLSEGCTTNRGWAQRGLGLHNSLTLSKHHMRVRTKSIHALWAWLKPVKVDILVIDVEGGEHAVLEHGVPSPSPAMIFFETSGFTNPTVNPDGLRLLKDVRDALERQNYVPMRLGDDLHDGWAPRTNTKNWKDDLWWLSGHPSLGMRAKRSHEPSKCPTSTSHAAKCMFHARYNHSHDKVPNVPVGCACTDGLDVQCPP